MARESRRDVLVVYNSYSPISVAIADAYVNARDIDPSNRFDVAIPLRDPGLNDIADEVISRADYEVLIRDPIANFLAKRGLARANLILVTIMGVPLRVAGSGEPGPILISETGASVDAELALLFSDLDGSAGILGSVNPFYRSDLSWSDWRALNPDAPLQFLVGRIAGYPTDLDPMTGLPSDVQELIARAQLIPADEGRWVIDEDGTGSSIRVGGDLNILRPAVQPLRDLGQEVTHDTTVSVVQNVPGIAGFASWGSNDSNAFAPPYFGAIGGVQVPGIFQPRSLAVTIVSTNARSFTSPPSYGQSLVADLIRLGASGVAGHVSEPGIGAIARPGVMFPAFVEGQTAVEAYFRSLPFLGWANVYIGDPLLVFVDVGADGDLDGVPDVDDICPNSPDAILVDDWGCTREQFCLDEPEHLDRHERKRACRLADWLDDEATSKEPKDCKISRLKRVESKSRKESEESSEKYELHRGRGRERLRQPEAEKQCHAHRRASPAPVSISCRIDPSGLIRVPDACSLATLCADFDVSRERGRVGCERAIWMNEDGWKTKKGHEKKIRACRVREIDDEVRICEPRPDLWQETIGVKSRSR